MQVYRGRRKYTGQTVAIKTISKHGKSQKDQITLRKEIHILSDLQHENIIRWMDAIETTDNFIVITEFAQGAKQFRTAVNAITRRTGMSFDLALVQ